VLQALFQAVFAVESQVFSVLHQEIQWTD